MHVVNNNLTCRQRWISNIHKFPDPWHWIQNCLEEWVERVFRFYEQNIRENSRARKRETTQYNTAKLTQTRPNMATPWHWDTVRKRFVNTEKSILCLFLRNMNNSTSYEPLTKSSKQYNTAKFSLFSIFCCTPVTLLGSNKWLFLSACWKTSCEQYMLHSSSRVGWNTSPWAASSDTSNCPADRISPFSHFLFSFRQWQLDR